MFDTGLFSHDFTGDRWSGSDWFTKRYPVSTRFNVVTTLFGRQQAALATKALRWRID